MGHRLRHGRCRTLIDAHRRFVLAETRLAPVPFVPEISLYQADEATSLWHRTARELERDDMPPPFWAFAWAGGRGLARFILDHPDVVAGRRVLDFASGSGLVAIAASLAGAVQVEAVDIDPFATAAIALNAEANGVAVAPHQADAIGSAIAAQIVLAGDIFYDRGFSARMLPWLRALAADRRVLVGDPARTYRPREGVRVIASLVVPVEQALEEGTTKEVSILEIAPPARP